MWLVLLETNFLQMAQKPALVPCEGLDDDDVPVADAADVGDVDDDGESADPNADEEVDAFLDLPR